MRAYYCDMCQTYFEGSAIGILYDNNEASKGRRYDLCAECLEDILKVVKGEATVCAGVLDDIADWQVGVSYEKGDIFAWKGKLYEVTLDHISTEINRPEWSDRYIPVVPVNEGV